MELSMPTCLVFTEVAVPRFQMEHVCLCVPRDGGDLFIASRQTGNGVLFCETRITAVMSLATVPCHPLQYVGRCPVGVSFLP